MYYECVCARQFVGTPHLAYGTRREAVERNNRVVNGAIISLIESIIFSIEINKFLRSLSDACFAMFRGEYNSRTTIRKVDCARLRFAILNRLVYKYVLKCVGHILKHFML